MLVSQRRVCRKRPLPLWVASRLHPGSCASHHSHTRSLAAFVLLFSSEKRPNSFCPRQPLDFLYANIKHAFYQPCNGVIDTKVILHFSLKHPIMVGKKAHKEIQVRTDV